MSNEAPRPLKSDVLERLKAEITFSAVVDVGVREMTEELIAHFPHLQHFLFEPVPNFFPAIRHNYQSLNAVLCPVALTDAQTQKYILVTSISNNGIPTHGQLVDSYKEPDGKQVISCDPTQIMRFDETNIEVPDNFLLKVDVDGHDTHVLRGFGDHIKRASVIIVESTIQHVAERIALCSNFGFQLYDIVDLIYYGTSLYQFDLVFVRKELYSKEMFPGFSPFEPDKWKALEIQ